MEVRRKLGSESVKTQFSKIYFSQICFLMAMNSHTCLSGASHADMHLTGYISHRACVLWACISEVYNSEARISGACISFTSLPSAHELGGENPYIDTEDVLKLLNCGRLGR
jgi:hypothetical protein